MEKRIMAKTDLDEKIASLVHETDHVTLAVWAADCAERVLPYFENKYPKDDRPRKAIKSCREWARTGVFKMADVRSASLSAHAAAREVKEFDPARSAARAAGQAIASAHVKTHSIAAAIYAATAIRDSARPADAEKAALKEREWQYRLLLKLRDG
jgi:hypothetical protein